MSHSRYGRVRGPVEDVVGRDVEQVGADGRGGFGHVAGADGVDRIGQVDLGLARVDRGKGSAVEDELGPERTEHDTARRRDRRRGMVPMSVASTS